MRLMDVTRSDEAQSRHDHEADPLRAVLADEINMPPIGKRRPRARGEQRQLVTSEDWPEDDDTALAGNTFLLATYPRALQNASRATDRGHSAMADSNTVVPKPPEKPASEPPAPKALLVLDGIKSAILIALWATGLVFLIWNWSKLGDMVTGMSRLELLGVKVELTNKSYNDSGIVSSSEKKMGGWTDEQRKATEVRAMWMRPILASSKILWVDGGPEYLNNEMSFLTAQRVNIRIARTSNDAIDRVKNALKGDENKFDLIVSSIRRGSAVQKDNAVEQNPRDMAKECPVHFFTIPDTALPDEGKALRSAEEENPNPLKYYPNLPQLVSEYNKKANEQLDAGFHFAQMLRREITDKNMRPPIIFYSLYANTIATACSDVVTNDMFTLMNAIFDTLERRRAGDLDHYRPPWSDGPRPSTTGGGPG